MSQRESTLRRAAIACALAGALLASGASATVPETVDYQGLLLDSGGTAVNGLVDLELTFFDALTNGNPVWSELHTDVDVIDGVYSVQLGSQTPLDAATLDDVLYLQVTVDGEVLTPRHQLNAVPYALRAAFAEESAGLGGVDAGFFAQIVANVSFDGQEPPNDDPSEGLGDADGDGVANFLESDNDDDGLADSAELSGGSDMNLPTPVLQGFDPPVAESTTATTVSVLGQNFATDMSVAFGSQSPTPSNVSPTSFDVLVGPQPVGPAKVVVTRSNGESDSLDTSFAVKPPVIQQIAPQSGPYTEITAVTINGQDFLPGTTVDFGSQNLVPTSITPTSLELQVGPDAGGLVDVTVNSPNGTSDSVVDGFEFFDTLTVFVLPLAQPLVNTGLGGADSLCTTAAAASGLGPHTAWLSSSSEDAGDHISKPAGYGYALVNGTLIANDFADLTDGGLAAPISRTASGSTVGSGPVWTATLSDGSAAAETCADWSSGAATGRVGNSAVVDARWTDDQVISCASGARVYCFQDF